MHLKSKVVVYTGTLGKDIHRTEPKQKAGQDLGSKINRIDYTILYHIQNAPSNSTYKELGKSQLLSKKKIISRCWPQDDPGNQMELMELSIPSIGIIT